MADTPLVPALRPKPRPVSASTGAKTVRLPSCRQTRRGAVFAYVKSDSSANTVTIAPYDDNSGAAYAVDQILDADGTPYSPVLALKGHVVWLQCAGRNTWRRLNIDLPWASIKAYGDSIWGAIEGNGAQYLMRTGAITETMPRTAMSSAGLAFLVSGQQSFVAVPLLAGQTVNNITFYSGTTAVVTPTHQWFSLYDASGNKLAVTSDDTTTAWAAQTEKTLALTAPFTVTSSGLYYFGCTVAAATVPTMCGIAGNNGYTLAPAIAARDTTHTGLTDPTTAPAVAALVGLASHPWAWAA